MTTAIEEKTTKIKVNGKAVRTKQERERLCNSNIFIERVEKKAYELFEQRGRQNGHHFDDWFKALEIVEKEMIEGK